MLAAGILTTPVAAIPLTLVDNPTGPLNECEGDCNDDADCAGDLVCFFRKEDFNNLIPPGCESSGAETGNSNNFCYDRDGNYPHTAQHFGFANEQSGDVNLNVCESDCNKNKHCAPGLECFQRRADEDGLPPGCVGEPYSTYDYCYDPDYVDYLDVSFNSKSSSLGVLIHFQSYAFVDLSFILVLHYE